MPSALVLDAQSRAGLETIQSLGRHGVTVHAAAVEPCLAHRSRYLARYWSQPSGVTFLDWVRRLDAEFNYSLIVPSTELSLLMLLPLEKDDPLVRKAVMPSRAAIETALNKWATLELA